MNENLSEDGKIKNKDITGIKKVELHNNSEWTFSTYVRAGDFIFTSHIGGIVDKEGKSLDTIEEQTVQVFENLNEILEDAGVTLNDVVKTTVYLRDLTDFSKMRDIYREYFTAGYPARMTASTEFIENSCLIMIEAIAYKINSSFNEN